MEMDRPGGSTFSSLPPSLRTKQNTSLPCAAAGSTSTSGFLLPLNPVLRLSGSSEAAFNDVSDGIDPVDAIGKLRPQRDRKTSTVDAGLLTTRTVSSHSQGTTVVHGRDGSVSPFPTLPEDFVPSQSSSRRTTFLVGPFEQSRKSGEKDDIPAKPTADDLKRHAEGEFYKRVAEDGTQRGRSMIRNVSREDYLLGRGANPRTGLVTPVGHSANSSLEEAGILRQRGVLAPVKWRQRGDAWISLQPGQPTPLPTPPASSVIHSEGLRVPTKINQDRFNQNAAQTRHPNASFQAHSHHDSQQSLNIKTPTDFPGAYPQTPQREHDTDRNSPMRKPHLIPRKPVGPSPEHPNTRCKSGFADDAEGDMRSEQQHLQAQAHRSSSAPATQKAAVFRHADTGKDLPSLPQSGEVPLEQARSLTPQKGFLDLGPEQITGPNLIFKTSENSGKAKSGKGLPCLPTSSSQSQLNPIQKPDNATPPPSHSKKAWLATPAVISPSGQKDHRWTRPYDSWADRTHPVRMRYVRDCPETNLSMPVPVYDNPPPRFPKTWTQSSQTNTRVNAGPRTTLLRNEPQPKNDVFTTPRTTTSTSTLMFTDTFPTRRPRPPRPTRPRPMGPRINSSGPFHPVQYRTSNLPVKSMNDCVDMGTDIGDRMATSQISIQPQPWTRPAMPTRRIGMQAVPQADVIRTRYTAAQDLLRSTGMPLQDHEQDSSVDPRTRFTVHPNPRPTENVDAKPNAVSQTLPVSSVCGLQRKCSRCINGFVTKQQLNTGGAIPVPGPRLKASVGGSFSEECEESPEFSDSTKGHSSDATESESQATSTSSQSSTTAALDFDQRDHQGCCSLCCKEYDCHEGCLSHPSPNASPTRPRYPGFGPLSGRTDDSDPSQSLPLHSKTKEGRFGFVRSAIKRSMERSPGVSKKIQGDHLGSSTDAAKDRLDRSPDHASLQPLSPAIFWGSNETDVPFGAVEAAKAAIEKQNREFQFPSAEDRGKGKSADQSNVPIVAPAGTITLRKVREKKRRRRSRQSINDKSFKCAIGSESPQNNPDETQSSNTSGRLRLTVPADSTTGQGVISKSRNVSGASLATIDIPMPTFGAAGISTFWEILLVPYEASRMWLRNHPRVITTSWHILERGWEMGQVMIRTASKLWSVVFVYSKTGRLRLRRGDTAGLLVVDCGRSALYLLIFITIGMLIGRILGCFLWGIAILEMVLRGLLWTLKTLFGHGLLW